MNTTQKGDKLENLLYHYLNSIVDNYGKFVRLNKKKRYKYTDGYSTIVDVSIDVYHSQDDYNSDSPTMSYIFECKNTNRKLDIQDFNEVLGRCARLAMAGVKPIIVNTTGFSIPTITAAKIHKIGLMTFPITENKPNIIVPRLSTQHSIYELERIIRPDLWENSYVYKDGIVCDFVSYLIKNNVPIKENFRMNNIYIPDEEIEDTVKFIYSHYKKNSSEDIIDVIFQKNHQLKLKPIDYGITNQLGGFDMNNLVIGVSVHLQKEDPRYRFTIAHELGHYFLHYKILNKLLTLFQDDEISMANINTDTGYAIEIQANKFASMLLLPTDEVRTLVLHFFDLYEVKDYLYVDKQCRNYLIYYKLIEHLKYKYKVSRQTATYKLLKMGLIQLDSKFKV